MRSTASLNGFALSEGWRLKRRPGAPSQGLLMGDRRCIVIVLKVIQDTVCFPAPCVCHTLSLGFVGVRRGEGRGSGSERGGLTFTTLLNKLNKLVCHNLKELIQQKNKKYPQLHGAFELFRQFL